MSENEIKKTKLVSDDDGTLNFLELIYLLWANKIVILSCSLIVSIFAFVYSQFLPNLYTSLSVVTLSNSIENQESPMGGLASLAGISLGGQSSKDDEGIEIMNSLNFFENLVERNDLFEKLALVNGWDKETNTLIYDKSKFDENSKKWISKKPSMQDLYSQFHKRFTIDKNNQGFIELSFKHYSPYFAKEIVSLVIDEINFITKNNEIEISSNSLNFLKNEIERSKLVEIRKVIADLIQKETQTIMMANSSNSFLFKKLSEPYAPEIKSEPNRSFILLIGFLIGFLISASYFIVRNFTRQNSEN